MDLFIDSENIITKENNTIFFKIWFTLIWLVILEIFFTCNEIKTNGFFSIELAIFIILCAFLFFSNKIHLDERIKLFSFLLFLFGWIFFMISLLYIGNKYILIQDDTIDKIILVIFFALIKITTHTIQFRKSEND